MPGGFNYGDTKDSPSGSPITTKPNNCGCANCQQITYNNVIYHGLFDVDASNIKAGVIPLRDNYGNNTGCKFATSYQLSNTECNFFAKVSSGFNAVSFNLKYYVYKVGKGLAFGTGIWNVSTLTSASNATFNPIPLSGCYEDNGCKKVGSYYFYKDPSNYADFSFSPEPSHCDYLFDGSCFLSSSTLCFLFGVGFRSVSNAYYNSTFGISNIRFYR